MASFGNVLGHELGQGLFLHLAELAVAQLLLGLGVGIAQLDRVRIAHLGHRSP